MDGSKRKNKLEKKAVKAEAKLQKKLTQAGVWLAPATNAESSDRASPVPE